MGLVEEVPDAADEVALEAADGFFGAPAFGTFASDVVLGLGAAAQARDGDDDVHGWLLLQQLTDATRAAPRSLLVRGECGDRAARVPAVGPMRRGFSRRCGSVLGLCRGGLWLIFDREPAAQLVAGCDVELAVGGR